MIDHVGAYCRASERADVDALMATLAPGGEMVSPLAGGATFRNPDDLRILFAAVYGSLTDLRWEERYRDGSVHTVLGRARVLGREVHDAMVIETDDEGRLRRIRPHLRPRSGLTAFALAIGPRMIRHPGVLTRATRSEA